MNPRQYAPLVPYFQQIGVPGFANGGAANNNSPSSPSRLVKIVLQGVIALPDSRAYLETADGSRQVIEIVNEAKLQGLLK